MEKKTPDLIDRAALVQEVNRDIDRCYALGIGAVGPLSNFLDQIQRQPTVDAVQVIRCKDCALRWRYNGALYCNHERGPAGIVEPEHFCSYGEKEGGKRGAQ